MVPSSTPAHESEDDGAPSDGDGAQSDGDKAPGDGEGAPSDAEAAEDADAPPSGDDHEHAETGTRLAAHVVDVLVLVPVFWGSTTAVAVATGNVGGAGFSMSGGDAWLSFGVYFALMAAYFVGLEGLLGWTPGKRLLGCRVAREDGGPVGLRAAAVRNATRLVEGAPFFWFFLFYPVSLILVNENHRRLGDRVADTVVVAAD